MKECVHFRQKTEPLLWWIRNHHYSKTLMYQSGAAFSWHTFPMCHSQPFEGQLLKYLNILISGQRHCATGDIVSFPALKFWILAQRSVSQQAFSASTYWGVLYSIRPLKRHLLWRKIQRKLAKPYLHLQSLWDREAKIIIYFVQSTGCLQVHVEFGAKDSHEQE